MPQTPGSKPKLLILSFSKIEADVRVMRQVNEFIKDYEVTTCGNGPRPHPEVEHIRLIEEIAPLHRKLQGILLNLKQFALAYAVYPTTVDARRKLRGRVFDAVLVNDLPGAGVALGVAPSSKIHLDLHEYWLGLNDENASWRRLRIPYHSWMLREHAAKLESFTTVNRVIAERYLTEFGFRSDIVTNASTYQDLKPQPVNEPLRIVHAGGVNSSRRIDVMMRAIADSHHGATLDLYLMGEGSHEYRKLAALADELGDRVQVHPGVSQTELISTLNQYDVGIHVLAPTSTNNRLALPNKLFDYVQARIAVVIGPTEAMVEVLNKHELGVVTEGFELESITRAVDELTTERVQRFKENADRGAKVLSSESQIPVWRAAIETIRKSLG